MIIVGRNPVGDALNSGIHIYELLVGKGSAKNLEKLINLAQSRGIKVVYCSKDKLSSISDGASHQGIAANVREPELVSVEDIAKKHDAGEGNGLILLLDEVQDPYNVGALIRTALAAGADGVVIPGRRSAPPITPVTVKASAAAVMKIPVAVETNLAYAIEKLKNLDYWIYGADINGEKAYYDVEYATKVALVVGGEGKGLRRLTREKCDFLVNIPISLNVESLNVSTAAAVILFEIARKKQIFGEKTR